jgi:uncharacterized membrane protein YraQ (UPF0718 family)
MIAYAYGLTSLWFPYGLVEQAKRHAERAQQREGMEMQHGMAGSWREKLVSRQGWEQIAHAFFMEWKMVWKEILFGFTVAGFIAVFVPQSFWNSLFLIEEGRSASPSFLIVLENALVAPIVAFFTFIGSMGNVPLAAMLWSREVSFGGAMAFLGADLVAATVIWVHGQVLRLAVCALPLGSSLCLHGRGGRLGALYFRVARRGTNRANLPSGDGPLRDRPHVLSQHRIHLSCGHSNVAAFPRPRRQRD